MAFLLSLLCTVLLTSLAWANCVTFDLATWTPEQRNLFGHVVVTSVNDGVQLRRLRDANVEVCALTADLSALSQTTLQSTAQTIVTAHATALSEAHARRTAAQMAMKADDLCDTIQERIEATNTVGEVVAALKQLATCLLNRPTLQGGE